MSLADLLAEYPAVLTTRDVQDILRISRTKAYELMNDPAFGAVKIGGSIRITKARLIQNIETEQA